MVDTKLQLVLRLQFLRSGECGLPHLLPLLPGSLRLRILISVRVPCIDQTELFKNYSYLIGPYAPPPQKNLLKSNYTKM